MNAQEEWQEVAQEIPEVADPKTKVHSLLSARDILDRDDTCYEYVDVPEWGGRLRIRSMTGAERDAYEKAFTSMDKKGNMQWTPQNVRALLISMTAVDEHGANLFSRADVLRLGQKNAAAMERVVDVSRRLSGLTKEDQAELENFSMSESGSPTG